MCVCVLYVYSPFIQIHAFQLYEDADNDDCPSRPLLLWLPPTDAVDATPLHQRQRVRHHSHTIPQNSNSTLLARRASPRQSPKRWQRGVHNTHTHTPTPHDDDGCDCAHRRITADAAVKNDLWQICSIYNLSCDARMSEAVPNFCVLVVAVASCTAAADTSKMTAPQRCGSDTKCAASRPTPTADYVHCI